MSVRQKLINERGSILSFWVLMLPVLLVFGGLVIDTGIISLKKSNLSGAVDAAAWAALDSYDRQVWTDSNKVVLDNYHAQQLANQYLYKNMPGATVSSVKIINENQVEVVATIQVPLYFLKLFGFNEVTLTDSSKVQIS
ncbi:TadE/TadG family type IV pilus assembly protein [Robertmurraya korlensis]|uniref:TadE/TadG family type IV pilus assembly protein n=1 Tax=Robertmurraya korlensis TaxID=519977 RepID=UPI000824769E|nr:pilus assembly protein TadG-related protein [Robertmurraya korlensis]